MSIVSESRRNSRSAAVAAGVFACRRAGASRPADKTPEYRTALENFLSLKKCGRFFRAAGCRPLRQAGRPTLPRGRSPFNQTKP